jgi:hypothetical protein
MFEPDQPFLRIADTVVFNKKMTQLICQYSLGQLTQEQLQQIAGHLYIAPEQLLSK